MKKIIFVLILIFNFYGSKAIKADTIWTASPNPFISSTIITIYDLASDTITLKIYNQFGNLITSFFTDTILSGTISISFNADTLPDGVYIASLKKNSETFNKNLVKTITADQSEILNLKFPILIFPNPVGNDFTVEFEASVNSLIQFTVHDYTGKQVLQIQKQQLQARKYQEQINTEQLANGFYFFIANINGQIQTFKLIKM